MIKKRVKSVLSNALVKYTNMKSYKRIPSRKIINNSNKDSENAD